MSDLKLDEDVKATRLKMFVWDGRGKYKVTVCATNVAEARALALEEMSIKGDLLNMREHVEQEQPLIYHRANAEIALTESGETEELNICLEAETQKRKAVESELAIARDLIERHKEEEPACESDFCHHSGLAHCNLGRDGRRGCCYCLCENYIPAPPESMRKEKQA